MQRSKEELLVEIKVYHDVWMGRTRLDREWQVEIFLDGLKRGGSVAETHWSTHYRTADQRFGYEQCRSMSPRELEQTVLHEIGHLYTADLYDAIVEHVGDGTKAGGALQIQMETLIDRWANDKIATYNERNANGIKPILRLEGAEPGPVQEAVPAGVSSGY